MCWEPPFVCHAFPCTLPCFVNLFRYFQHLLPLFNRPKQSCNYKNPSQPFSTNDSTLWTLLLALLLIASEQPSFGSACEVDLCQQRAAEDRFQRKARFQVLCVSVWHVSQPCDTGHGRFFLLTIAASHTLFCVLVWVSSQPGTDRGSMPASYHQEQAYV